MDNKKKNIIQVNFAVLIWGGTVLFAKIIALPVFHIIFGRSFFGAIILFLFIKIKKISLKIANRKEFLYNNISGIFNGSTLDHLFLCY